MDGKVLNFPKSKRKETEPTNVLYLKWVAQAHIINLTEMGRKVRAMQKEVRKTKARLLLRVVENGTDNDKD